MNQRISELAEQAGLEYNFDPMTWLKYEKFAKLIIWECVESLTELDEDYIAIYQQHILDHFGMVK